MTATTTPKLNTIISSRKTPILRHPTHYVGFSHPKYLTLWKSLVLLCSRSLSSARFLSPCCCRNRLGMCIDNISQPKIRNVDLFFRLFSVCALSFAANRFIDGLWQPLSAPYCHLDKALPPTTSESVSTAISNTSSGNCAMAVVSRKLEYGRMAQSILLDSDGICA